MGGSKGLVSVIVSVHNIETLLPICLESLMAQTYQDLDILLIDDGSTDGSGHVCDRFAAEDSRVRVIHQENQGIWAVRNRGVVESRGEYLVFPDGDDYFHKDYIRFLYEAINKDGEEYPLAICDFQAIRDYEGDTSSDSFPVFEVMDHETLMDKILDYPDCVSALWGANWNKLYRKSALPMPFQKNYRRCQDFDSNIRVFFQIDNAVYVRKVLYYWLQWPGQSTRAKDDKQIRNECRCQIFLENYRTFPSCNEIDRSRLLTNLYRRMIVWKESVRDTPQESVVARKVVDFERKTWTSFLMCKYLPFPRKMRWLLFLHAPSLLKVCGKKVNLEYA